MDQEGIDTVQAVWHRPGVATNERILILFKIGKEEHLASFREQGQMHMCTMRAFAIEEGQNLARGDRFEGASFIYQPAGLQMTISHPVTGTIAVDPNDLVGPVIISSDRAADQNIFCMFSLTAPAPQPLFHEKLLYFGSHFVLILNTPEFLKRIHQAMVTIGLEGEHGPVQYYDEGSYSGKINAFSKPSRFAYQREFRIIARPGIVPFRDLLMGDISDIASPALPLMELDRLVDFSEQAANDIGWVKSGSQG